MQNCAAKSEHTIWTKIPQIVDALLNGRILDIDEDKGQANAQFAAHIIIFK